jgi:hypothetical protein
LKVVDLQTQGKLKKHINQNFSNNSKYYSK